MSDLTRLVLGAHQFVTDATACDWAEIDRARAILENAAPILTRQIEAVEALTVELKIIAGQQLANWRTTGNPAHLTRANAIDYTADRLWALLDTH
ncbi:hypothetical protein [Micrococcus lylae]|uniref:hypothetical protein n=1 Tax=Micrococcus lylae TaxID=1273 RepID=UPI000C80C968|nr:hypothetical protein [Micrococcus lylae]WIK82144.1 hypothetical protein CJ228_011250 [Micrococcus lylae]